MSRRLVPPAVAAAVALAALLAGCATQPVGSVSPSPTGTTVDDVPVRAAWLDGGSMIGLVLDGASSCVPVPGELDLDAGVLSITLMDPVGATCTRDLTPRGVPITLPRGADPAQGLRVEVAGAGYRGAVELPGVSNLVSGTGPDSGLPSAGWVDADALALLTWGSSSCRPQVEDIAVSDSEVALRLATPPADQVCTADLGPRVTVVPVSAAQPGATYEMVVSGASPDTARIPVAGTP